MGSTVNAGLALVLAIGVLSTGCGIVADKDLIEIARIGDRSITRGELKRAIRLLPAEQKPAIRTRGDVRKALTDYIDSEIKRIMAEELEQSGKIAATMEEAAQYYFANHPEHISIFQLQDPSQIGMTEAELEGAKLGVQEGIEHMRRWLLNEYAMGYLVQDALQAGRAEISDAEWEREYSIQKSRLMNPAEARIRGVIVPAEMENAQRYAAEARDRLEKGTGVDALAEEYTEADKGRLIDMSITNDRRDAQFEQFWEQAGEAPAGSHVGPIYLPQTQRLVPDGQGGMAPRVFPALFLVCRIEAMKPATQMTLEDAKPFLQSQILYTKMLRELREDFKVAVFDDKLPDPSVDDISMQAGPIRAADEADMDTGHGHPH